MKTKFEESVLNHINQVKRRLLLNRNIISNKDLLILDNWYSNSDNLITMNYDKDLYISNLENRVKYISLFEKNISFNFLPKRKIEILSGEKLKIFFEAIDSSCNLSLVLIEYTEDKKINTSFFSPNQEEVITLNFATKFIRLALRCNSKGWALIKKVSIERIDQNEKKSLSVVKHSTGRKIKNLKVACILDDFSMQCFGEEVNLIPVYPNNWKELIEEETPDFLLVESAWHGNNKSWQYLIGKYIGYSNEELIKLVRWFQDRNIPTVFWNKEDPFHFDKFIDSAKHFDYIYTTDTNMIKKYLAKVKHKNVYTLPFAAQPRRHNPIRLQEQRERKMCFAGTYYANRYEDRRRDMDSLLEIADSYGLAIYDRNFYRSEPEFKFPKRYKKNILGVLPYSKMDVAYKNYKYILNVNSIKESESMFSRRVFEGMACGTPIISNYSKGIEKIFGNLILASDDPNITKKNIDYLESEETIYRRQSLLGIREIFDKHTYKHRLEKICQNIGFEVTPDKKTVTMFSFAKSMEECIELIRIFELQNYKYKNLHIYISQFDDFTFALNNLNTENISIFLKSYLNNYEHMPLFTKSSYMGLISMDNIYGENYLTDLMIAAEYSSAEVIGKKTYFEATGSGDIREICEGNEYTFVSQLDIHSCIFRSDIRKKETLSNLLESCEEGTFDTMNFFELGARLFSSDKYNFIKNGQKMGSVLNKDKYNF